MNEKELKIKITTSNAQETINQVKEIEKQLKQLGETVKSVRKNADGSLTIRSAKESAGKIANITRKYNKEGTQLYTTQRINDLKKSTETLGSALHTVGTKTIATFTAAIGVVKGFYNGMEKLTTASINYSEALNLFNVVFKNIEKNGETTYSKLGKQAIQFQNKLKYNFGANMEESLTYQGLFQSMAESQGISDEAAYIMSENSTKLVYDLSSLFNKEQEDVAEALRAGIYAGQTKPLRTYGLDITENSLQVTLDKLKETNSAIGDLKVSTMSQAEKQILRYITVLEQASVAQGDFANTLNSPANQLKMLENQLKMTATSIGNLFVKPFNNILIFTNAILMVIENLADAIAKAFNIDVSDYNESIADYGDSFTDVEENIDSTTDAIKKLKRQTLGFDQINNITTDKSGKDDSGLGNINSALLGSLEGYKNGLETVENRARDISEKIMEWLGFTMLVDEETGKVSWKLDHITGGTVLGSLAVAGTTFIGIKKIVDFFKKIKELVGGTKTKDLANNVGKTNDNLATTLNNMTAIQKLLIGGTGLVVGLGLVSDSAKKLAEDADNLGARFENALGFLTASSGGALTGSSLQKFGDTAGVIGTTIGGVVGIVTSAYADYKTTVDNVIKLSDTLKYNNEKLAESYKPVLEQLRSSDWKVAYYEDLIGELDTIVDKNGKIKKGYEDRAKFIANELSTAYGVELEISKGVIKNYNKQIGKIKEVIEKKQAEIKLEVYTEAYKEAYKNKTKVLNNYLEAKKKYTTRSSNMSEEDVQALYDAYIEAERIYKNNEFVLDNYSKYVQGVQEGDLAATKRYGYELSMAITENAEGVNLHLSDIITEASDKETEMLKKYKTTYANASDEVKKEILTLYDDTIDVLTNMVTDLEPGSKLSKEQVAAWKKLARTNVDAYNEALSKLTPEQREILSTSMQTTYDKVKDIFSKHPILMKIKSAFDGSKIHETIKKLTGDTKKIIDDAFGSGTTNTISTGLKKVASLFGITGYATGGFPEDGLFFANHGELVGKFSNGKTAVANNEQITEGIRRAVMTGMSQALATSGGSNVVIDVRADEGIIVQKAINGINRITDATGESPLHI